MTKPKTLVAAIATVALLAASAAAQAQQRRKVERARAVPNATAAGFSTEVNLVQRTSPPNGGSTGTLVLNASHSFNVTLVATNWHVQPAVQGNGVALPQTDTFGYFSLPSITNNPSNPEVFIKILDGRPVNGFWWVFFGHLTDLIYDITVTENATGLVQHYHKDQGNQPGGFDTSAFAGSSLTPITEAGGLPAPITEATLLTPNAFVRTAVDIANNTSSSITADLQYAYTCTDPTCAVVGQFKRTTSGTIILPIGPFQSLHFDDMVAYLDGRGALAAGAGLGSTGSLLVTFAGLPTSIGWEATATGRTYNRISEVDPLRGTVGFDENGSLFFESSLTTLVGTAVDTRSAPACTAPGTPAGCTFLGSLLSQLAIVNTDLNNLGDNNPAYVKVKLYNPATGQLVGNTLSLSGILAGEVRIVPDLWAAAGVPGSVTSVIVVVDTYDSSGSVLHPSNAPTVEGFFIVQDTISLDTRFNELRCADPSHCGP